MADRPYEIVLLGATGFTGRLAALFLAEHVPDLRWALAGRNRDKLEAVRADLAAVRAACAELPLLHVDVEDRPTVDAMTAQAQVVLTTAGPFHRHGPPVVASCVEHGADYADITGEPPFVARMIREHHRAAAEAGVRIVHCCGFDSVPHDLGAHFTVRQLPGRGPIEVEAYVRARGRTSGGTWNTALDIVGTQARADLSGLVVQGPDKRAGGLKRGIHRAPVGGWGVPAPLIDPLIVQRSAQLLGYGPDFRYGHYVNFRSTRWLVATAVGLGAVAVGARIAPVRRWLKRRIPPGEGPSLAEMNQGWARIDFFGREGAHRVHTRVTIPVDPGYLFTARMASSAALCLARDRQALTDLCGVLTPAAAMAEPLQARLEALGMGFEVVDD